MGDRRGRGRREVKREKRRREEMKREEEIVTDITAKARFLVFLNTF